MTTYEIIANGVSLNTNEDINISLNYQIDDILNIKERPTNWTRSITLPGSATNNQFFKQIFDVNVDSLTFNPIKKIPTIVRIGDNTILNGNLQLEKISVVHELIEYQVSIYGILNNVFSDIKDLYLRDLDFSEFNHIRNQENIVNSYTYKIVKNGSQIQYEGPGNGYVYPYIIYGVDTSVYYELNIYDTFPALYTTPIFKRIIEEQGYEIRSKFLDSDYAKKLIMPFNGNKLEISEEQINNFSSVIGIVPDTIAATSSLALGQLQSYSNLFGWNRESGTVDDVSGELTFKDNLNQYNPGSIPNFPYNSGLWTCQNQGYYDITFNATAYAVYTYIGSFVLEEPLNYDEGSGDLSYRWRLVRLRNGIPTVIQDPGYQNFTPWSGSHASPWKDTAVPLTMNISVSNLLVLEGDQFYITYDFYYPSNVGWVGINDDDVLAGLVFDRQKGNQFSYLSFTPTSNVDMGNQMINMNDVVPDNYKQEDFITDYVKMFNLIITEDKLDPNILIIEPRDDYYATNNKILYWDNIYDNDTGYEVTPMSEVDSNEYVFTYTDDDDWLNKQYREAYKRTYGEYKINIGNDFSDKTSATKLSISPTPNSVKYTDGKVAPYFVQMDDEGMKPFKTKPRIIFYGGLIQPGNLVLQDFIGQGSLEQTHVTGYPYCGMWDNPFEPQHDLGFGPTSTIYWPTSEYPVKNLFIEFYKNTVNNLINPNARLLEAKFRLTPKDIAQFDFRNVVFLLGAYWRVNEIKNYDPTANDKLTTVVLYKILDAYTTDKVTNTLPLVNRVCPIDITTKKVGKKYVHVSRSGLPVSESCCSSLGGQWIDGTCYIGDYNPGVPFVGNNSNVLVPAPSPEGPNTAPNGNTVNSVGVKTHGHLQYVEPGVDASVVMIGKGNVGLKSAKNTLVIGDNQVADKENTINLNGTLISDNGTITPNFNMLSGPRDTVRKLFPYNPYWNKWKSGTDSVRDVDFISEINIIKGKRDGV